MKEQLLEIKQRIGEPDVQLSQIYDAIENLLDENAARRKNGKQERASALYNNGSAFCILPFIIK